MLIVGYCFGIRSERRLCEEVHLNLAYRLHEGTTTEGGWYLTIRVGVQYIEAWLRDRGAVPIYDRMDAATAEISRAQI